MGETIIGDQLPIAVITAYVLEWLKRQAWFPFAKVEDAGWLNRITAALAALATAGAIHYTFAANGDFVFNGNVYTVLQLTWAGVQQYALQHVVYKIAIAPPPSPVKMTSAQATGTIPVAVVEEVVQNK